MASGEPLEKLLCHPATPTAGIEHGLVPCEVQARHDCPPPSRLGQRQPVVRRAVPIRFGSTYPGLVRLGLVRLRLVRWGLVR